MSVLQKSRAQSCHRSKYRRDHSEEVPTRSASDIGLLTEPERYRRVRSPPYFPLHIPRLDRFTPPTR